MQQERWRRRVGGRRTPRPNRPDAAPLGAEAGGGRVCAPAPATRGSLEHPALDQIVDDELVVELSPGQERENLGDGVSPVDPGEARTPPRGRT